MTGEEVVDSAVFAVCHDSFSFGSGGRLVLFEKRQHQVRLVDIAGSGSTGGDHFVLAVHGPVNLIHQFRLTPVDDGGVGVGGGDVPAVLLLNVPGSATAWIAFSQAVFQLPVVLVQLVLQVFRV